MSARDPRRRYQGQPHWPGGVLAPRPVAARPGFLEHVVAEGDRLDRLAETYYGDARLWWLIAEANLGAVLPADLVYLGAGEADARLGLVEEDGVLHDGLGRAALRLGARLVIPAASDGGGQ